ncbi:hypothetical protein G5C01_04800 [Moraxella bovoculi]|uniref:hypothetical protein n=1 Tax=Moraxella bovoculi TaxID=386891 RepID=UPI0015714C6F|nr:hypothetical protein [Moraxella bovoculi]NSM10684.1 hypothetical protein [Moraxella bovoculi]
MRYHAWATNQINGQLYVDWGVVARCEFYQIFGMIDQTTTHNSDETVFIIVFYHQFIICHFFFAQLLWLSIRRLLDRKNHRMDLAHSYGIYLDLSLAT